LAAGRFGEPSFEGSAELRRPAVLPVRPHRAALEGRRHSGRQLPVAPEHSQQGQEQ